MMQGLAVALTPTRTRPPGRRGSLAAAGRGCVTGKYRRWNLKISGKDHQAGVERHVIIISTLRGTRTPRT